MSLVAATAASLACWIALGPVPAGRLRPRASRLWPRLGLARKLAPVAAVALATLVGLLGWGGKGASIAFAVALPLITALTVWRRHRARRAVETAAREVASACQHLAGLLRVGQVPGAALRLAAHDDPVLAGAAAIQAVGGDVARTLRRLGAGPGLAGLVELGVAWDVAERTGASLTATLDALADRLVGDRAVHSVVASELAAPRATGRLLAVLPLAGLALGYGFGGDPVAFLTGSLPGQLCLAAGALLGCVGVLWTERIAGAEES